MRPNLERRLAVLEAASAPPAPPDDHAAYVERAQRRLAALGLTGLDHRVGCTLCKWTMPQVWRPGSDDAGRCLVCGGRSFGELRRGHYAHLPAADFVCPGCGHAHSAPQNEVTPCPRCGWATPPPPDADDPNAANIHDAVTVVRLAAVHGVGAAAAWLDADDAAVAAMLDTLNPWYTDMCRQPAAN